MQQLLQEAFLGRACESSVRLAKLAGMFDKGCPASLATIGPSRRSAFPPCNSFLDIDVNRLLPTAVEVTHDCRIVGDLAT
jgi:hypothetical protein